MMIAFEVNDMTCGHCVRAITEAVHCADSGARVQVDLAAHRVQIEPVAAQAPALLHAIQQAGYTPTLLAASEPAIAASEPGPAAGQARGSSCGGGAGGGCGCGSR
ncbi:MAG: heavy-metal-associated domain-containing protein [Burkholderiaceae bacterium]|nr:heavy-metal-associated domain-containing protein [Burkholderiaceae bacterium]